MKLPLADALVSLIATGCLGVYQVTKRVIDPYLSFKREGRGFRRRQQQPPKTFVFFGKTLAVWRVVNFTSYVLNVLCVSIPGRIDDQMAKEMKEAQEEEKKKNKEDADADVDDEKKNDAFATKKNTIRRTSKYRSLFTPAGYAFAIWGFIFTSEFVFAVRSMFFTNTKDEQFAANATGYFALANVLQSVWCFTFREWTEKPRRHWINAFVLGVEALALWSSKERVFEVNGRFALAESGFVSVPIRTHFAWILCACGINANTVLAKIGSASAQVVFAIGTAVLATSVGAYSSFYRGDAATPLVFAWALYAIYKDGGYRAPPPSDSTSSSSGDKKDKKNKDGDEKKNTEKLFNKTEECIPSEKQTKRFTDTARLCAIANLLFAAKALLSL